MFRTLGPSVGWLKIFNATTFLNSFDAPLSSVLCCHHSTTICVMCVSVCQLSLQCLLCTAHQLEPQNSIQTVHQIVTSWLGKIYKKIPHSKLIWLPHLHSIIKMNLIIYMAQAILMRFHHGNFSASNRDILDFCSPGRMVLVGASWSHWLQLLLNAPDTHPGISLCMHYFHLTIFPHFKVGNRKAQC